VAEQSGLCFLGAKSTTMQAGTTIDIRKDIKSQLDELKCHPKESYNDVIGRLVSLAIDDEPLSEEAIQGLEEALEDVKRGRLIPESRIMKEYGVK
jgi:predicted CopG family antitoxin